MTAEDASDADADVQELEEFLDWRSKKAWKWLSVFSFIMLMSLC